MAYNVLKGNVQFINSNTGSIESMVDDHSNQTIGGIKTFSSAITASGGISSDAFSGTNITSTSASFAHLTVSSSVNQTPLLILEKGEAESSFIEFKKEGVKHAEIRANNVETFIIKTEATSYPIWFQQAGNYPLKFQDSKASFESYPVNISQSLHVTGSSFINNLSASNEISASAFFGSGQGLTNIPASGLNLGDSTDNSSGNLIVKISSSSGLESTSDGLRANPSLSTEKTSPVNTDKFMISDSAAGNAPKYMTYQNLAAGVTSGITTYPPAGNNGEVQIKNGSAFQGVSQLSFDTTANTLTVTGQITASALVSSSFYGDGNNLTNLPAAELSGNVNAGNINIGNGLFNNSNTLAVSASYGLTASAQGLEVTSSAISGLNVLVSEGLVVSPIRANTTGSVADGDFFLITDVSDSNQTKNATMTTLAAYMQDELTFTPAGGSNTQVQYNNSGEFAGSSTFTFNSATNTLAVQEVSSSGNISASFFYGDGSNLQNIGQSGFNVFTENFSVAQQSDILGIVTTGSAITASLNAANTYGAGQRFTFKDVSGSCSGSTNHIVISASAYGSGDRIDGQGVVKIQTAYGAVTIASDGVSAFYIVGTI
jgi:hypothetical protein